MRFIQSIAKAWWSYLSFLLFVIAEVSAIYLLYWWLGLIH